MPIGEMIDHNGMRHPMDLELEDVYYVPDCPINLMSTTETPELITVHGS